MIWIKRYAIPLLAAVLFAAALACIYPLYQYYIDPDATAYLTLAHRYVEGDFAKAINGYWSPWSIWLTALMMKAGVAPFAAAIVINAIGAIGFLIVSHSLFLLFRIGKEIQVMFHAVMVIFLLYAVFWQSFADLWECFFLLLVLRILLAERFLAKPLLWTVAGFIGALAYLAKAYSFPFFILEILVCTYFLLGNRGKVKGGRWLVATVVCIGTMLVFSTPWIYLLYQKYGFLTTGTAGSLNMSWYLVGHPYRQPDILHLLPPVYPDSPSYWEDPFYVNGPTPQFWHSPKLFALQIVRLGYNLLKFVQSIGELSCFFAVSVIIALISVCSKQIRKKSDNKLFTLSLSFLLFPVGYLLVNFQGRYLWYMIPLSMVITAVVLQQTRLFYRINFRLRMLVMFIWTMSYVAFPILGLKQMYRAGEKEFRMAEALKAQGIKGTFTSNIPYGPETQNLVRLSYFADMPYYYLPLPVSKDELLEEMRKYHVQYYFHFYEKDWSSFEFTDSYGTSFQEVTDGKIPGLKVFSIDK